MNLRSFALLFALAAAGCESGRYASTAGRDPSSGPTFVVGDCANSVTVRGDVDWPGTYRMPCGLTVYQALNSVGVRPVRSGESASAGTKVRVRRPGGEQVLYYGANHRVPDIALADGDVVEVGP